MAGEYTHKTAADNPDRDRRTLMKLPENLKWINTAEEINRRVRDNFQGRQKYIEVFQNRTKWLSEHMSQDSLVTNYYGFGGIGKSTLLKKLKDTAEKQNIKFVSYEFDDTENDPAAVILTLAVAIGRKYHGHIWDRTIDLLDQCGVDGSILEQNYSKAGKVYEAGTGLADGAITIGGMLWPEAALLKTISNVNKGYKTLKALRKNSAVIGGQFGKKEGSAADHYANEETLAMVLAEAFASDLRVLLSEQNLPLIIALDGLERYYKQSSDDAWLKQMIIQSEGIHWILSGRDKLVWNEDVWTMEADSDVPHFVSAHLEALSREESDQYFIKAEVVNKDDEKWSEYLFQLTDGVPFYMYLCVDIYVQLLNRGVEPSVENFDIEITEDKHNVQSKLIERWAGENADYIREFAAAYKWNNEILKDASISLSPSAKDWFALSKKKSIFQLDQRGSHMFHDVIQEVITENALSKEMHGFMNHMQANAEFYMDAVKQVNGNPAVLYTGADTLLYYLNLKNDKWHTDAVNTHSIIRSLLEYCQWFQDCGDWHRELELCERLLAFVDGRDDIQEPVRGDVYSWYAMANYNMGGYSEALEYYQKDIDICERIYGTDHIVTAEVYNDIGSLYQELGEYPTALEYLSKALEVRQNILGPDHPDVAGSYNNLGLLLMNSGHYEEAENCFSRALDLIRKLRTFSPSFVATVFDNCGLLLTYTGRYSEALKFLTKALEIREKELSPDHPNLAESHNNIAGVFSDMGDSSNALDHFKQALEIEIKILGPEHPLTGLTYNNIVTEYLNLGDCNQAEPYNLKALEINEKSVGTMHPNTAITYSNTGAIHFQKGEYPEALEFNRKALEIRMNVYGPGHPEVAMSYRNIAGVYVEMHEYDMALKCFQNALAILERTLGIQHLLTIATYDNIAQTQKKLGHSNEAVLYFWKSYTGIEKALGKEHPNTNYAFSKLSAAIIDHMSETNDFNSLDPEVRQWIEQNFTLS